MATLSVRASRLTASHGLPLMRHGMSTSVRTSHTEIKDLASTMPPGYKARVGLLQTFCLPERVTGSQSDRTMGKALVDAWQKDGILQIAMTPRQEALHSQAQQNSQEFFSRPHAEKAACVDSQSYSGYIASGEEITDGIADYSEIFTVTKDLELGDAKVKAQWPCHGRCPWPDAAMRDVMKEYMNELGNCGETMLRLLEYGLEIPEGTLTQQTDDGWHHLRILRFPPHNKTNGKGKKGRGIGSHTDYGLLVIAAQDDVGGLFIRPPYQGEKYANWEKSAAGMAEEDEKWTYVPPVPGVFTVFPGDMMQYMSNSTLPSTSHKVGLNTRDRFAFAYFHEPNFKTTCRPLPGYDAGQTPREGIHYGTHFTNMFLRNYPDRITTSRMNRENRYKILKSPEVRDG
ncbi:uncharacterized protein JN550_013676 [Neoarthrinium moseri]|uniref:uncharacterized protein n=1 Tax=Neoarthrinium moseri TaxID=1658444 RepID=UPI001FDCC2FD|nr:uncharacterized protein JN550_013676 [Neoarthrinium moseri]KAI1856709.1 hypothetical protein JN550_013676 [Neoarthrinium moseri]